MDKKTIGSIALIGLLFLGYVFFNHKETQRYEAELAAYEERVAIREAEDVKQRVETQRVAEAINQGDSTVIANQKAQSVAMLGEALADAKLAEAKTLTLENDVLSVTFTTRGAQLKDVKLKKYTKYAPEGERSQLVELFDPSTAKMDLSFFIVNGFNNVRVNTSDYTFTPSAVRIVEGGKQQSFTLDFGGGANLEYIYTLYNTSDVGRDYLVDFDVKFNNMSGIMANQNSLLVDWQNRSYQNERGFTNENTYTTISYHLEDESGIKDLGVSNKDASDDVNGKINWVAFKQQFFTSALIVPSCMSDAKLSFDTAEPHSGFIKSFAAQLSIPFTPTTTELDMALYLGPNDYNVLTELNDLGMGDLRLDELVPLGWGIFGWVNKWFVIPLFDFLHHHIKNFGVIIFILAFLVKLIISPLTYSSYVSMAKMRIIKPEVDEIGNKYPKKEDAMKKQQATMELYKKAGINPMGGCIPMLIQMPIIIAMFRFFPASIELRDQKFLWANDLSSYDSVLNLPFEIPFYGDHVSLFALLMAVVLFFYSLINYQQTSSTQTQMPGMKIMMVYMMPIMMLLWFNSYSSGLCYYYFLSNLFTIFQTLIIRRLVDDDKIHAIMRANAAKRQNGGGKKSKFQQRYEELMAQQQNSANKNKK
ncbi:MAG: membrane protein insertase YidC [Rikenellaceae bacterium]